MDLTRSGNIHVPDAQAPINEDHRRIAEILKEYDPYLELHFIPPGSRTMTDVKPWAVVCRQPGMDPYVIFYCDDANELLLARVIRADNANKNVLNEIEAANLAVEALQAKRMGEERHEAHLQAAAILASSKTHYKHNGVDFGAGDQRSLL